MRDWVLWSADCVLRTARNETGAKMTKRSDFIYASLTPDTRLLIDSTSQQNFSFVVIMLSFRSRALQGWSSFESKSSSANTNYFGSFRRAVPQILNFNIQKM